jgi:hypothetical protein
MTAASREPWTRLLEQESWHRRAGTGQPELNIQDRTARETGGTVHPGQETEDKTASKNRTVRIGQLGQDKVIGQP